jgi:hypothetical protein
MAEVLFLAAVALVVGYIIFREVRVVWGHKRSLDEWARIRRALMDAKTPEAREDAINWHIEKSQHIAMGDFSVVRPED